MEAGTAGGNTSTSSTTSMAKALSFLRKNVTRKSVVAEIRRAIAEIYGTAALTFVAAFGLVAERASEGRVSTTAASVSSAILIAALIYSTGHISGAHFNPAVTWAFALRREFSVWRVPIYWTCQLTGALIAAGFVHHWFGGLRDVGSTVPEGVTTMQAFGMEIIFSILLLFTTLSTAERGRVLGANAALAVAAVLAAITLMAGPLTGASMNAARSLGPALVAGGYALSIVWIYVAASFIGATATVILMYILAGGPSRAASLTAEGGGSAYERESLTRQ